MIKYRATWSLDGDVIREVEVLRESPKFVVVERDECGKKKATRYAKRGRHDNFFDTWEEAHQFICDKATARFQACERNLYSAQRQLERVAGMKP